MRITEDAGRLSLLVRPNWLLMFIGVVMCGLAFAVAVSPGRTMTLACDRTGLFGTCEITADYVFYGKRRVVRFPLAMLDGARVEALPMGNRYFYRLHLLIDDGRGPYYFTWYGREDSALAAAGRVDAFVAQGAAAAGLSLVSDRRGMVFPLAGALVAAGLGLFGWGTRSLHTTFDRSRSQVTVRRRGRRDMVVGFDEVVDFHVAGLGGDCQLSMELASGRRLRLSASSDLASMGGPRRMRARHLALADRLRKFLAPDPLG